MTTEDEEEAVIDHALVERCREILRIRPSALLSDIDGTLSEIAPTPDAAFVAGEIRESLEQLVDEVDLLGFVTGRAANAAVAMVGVERAVYVGNHGLEEIRNEEWTPVPEAEAAMVSMDAALQEIQAAIDRAGLREVTLVEHKGLSGSVHYRQAPDAAAARSLLMPMVIASVDRHGLRLTEGRMVLEVRPQAKVSKGTATARLLRDHGIRGAIFLGDDVTDIDAFRALREARAAGIAETLAIGVLGEETPKGVVDAMDVGVRGVAEVGALLAALARP